MCLCQFLFALGTGPHMSVHSCDVCWKKCAFHSSAAMIQGIASGGEGLPEQGLKLKPGGCGVLG